MTQTASHPTPTGPTGPTHPTPTGPGARSRAVVVLALLQGMATAALLWAFLYGAGIDQHPGSSQPVPPHTQVIRPATTDDAIGADLIRELQACRAHPATCHLTPQKQQAGVPAGLR